MIYHISIFLTLLLSQVASSATVTDLHDVIIHMTHDDIRVSANEKLYGLQFQHKNCDLQEEKNHEFEIHHSDKIALAYSSKSVPLSKDKYSKLFSIDSNCEIFEPIAAGEKGRHLSVTVKNEK